jgi:hypothetical protein
LELLLLLALPLQSPMTSQRNHEHRPLSMLKMLDLDLNPQLLVVVLLPQLVTFTVCKWTLHLP